MRQRILCVAMLVVLGVTPFARADAPALELFEAAARHLALGYGGAAVPHPRELLAAARADLLAACADDAACPAEEAAAVLSALVAGLDDPHSRLLDPEGFARWSERMGVAGERPDVGLWLAAPAGVEGFVVLDVLPDGPAAAAGLSRGDRIVRLDGAPLPASGEDRHAAWRAALARGAFDVVVQRADAAPRAVALATVLQAPDVPPSLTWLEGGVAWLRVAVMLPTQRLAPAVHALVAEAIDGGARALLLDLRDDPGGAWCDCVDVAGAFVADVERVFVGPSACIGFRYRDGALDTYDPLGTARVRVPVPGAVRWTGPAAVLVNARTSSCAESVAHELQRAGIPVVGEPTEGLANAAVAMVPLPHGYGLVLTVALAVDAGGVPLPARVEPDVSVVDDLEALAYGRDPVLEAARAVARPAAR